MSDKNGQIFSGEDSSCLEVRFAKLYGEFEWQDFALEYFKFSISACKNNDFIYSKFHLEIRLTVLKSM